MDPQRASPADEDALLALETAAFEPTRREDRTVIRRSLRSPHQEVWVLREGERGVVAALVLRFTPRSVRVHSVAVHPAAQGRGLGHRLLDHALARARDLGRSHITLEASADSPALLAWYAAHGYEKRLHLPDYYAPGGDAWRLRRRVP